jgi:hypothetical protein
VETSPNHPLLALAEADWTAVAARPAVGARFHVDEVARYVNAQGRPTSAIRVSGWAFLDGSRGESTARRVLLRGADAAFAAPLREVARPDVGAAFGDPRLGGKGFVTGFDATELPDGEFGVHLHLTDGGPTDALVDTGRRLRIMRRALTPPDASPPLLLSVHIPKTAGTTFRAVLEGLYPGRVVLDEGHAAGTYIDLDARCIHGHFRSAHYLRLTEAPRLLTWLRDPVERVVSHWRFLRRLPASAVRRNALGRAVQEGRLSLVDFAAAPEVRNLQAFFLNHASRAEDAIASVDFVGIVEEFDASLRLLARVLDLPAVPSAGRENVSSPTDASEPSSVSPDMRADIRRLNELDGRLYAEGRRQFALLCDRYSIT